MIVQHMGREPAVNRQPVVGNDELIEPQRRDPANLRERSRVSVLAIMRKPRLEIGRIGILGLAAHADDVGKAEFGAIGVVDPLERGVFGVRQPVEPGTVLFGGQFRRESRGAPGLVGEIGMRPDQCELHSRSALWTAAVSAANSR